MPSPDAALTLERGIDEHARTVDNAASVQSQQPSPNPITPLPSLVCPACGSEIPVPPRCPCCAAVLSTRDGVYRYLSSGYASSFAAQWLEFARTQLDSANGTRISEDRFADVTGWRPEDLAGKTVLDVGCGAGRFTEVAARWGAHVTALDLSDAVFAAHANVAGAEGVRFVQADALHMPLPRRAFDFAFSIGVAQHTPDPLAFARAVGEAVRPGGQAALWIYERKLTSLLRPKYLLRPVTRRMPTRFNRALASALVATFFPLAELLNRAPAPARTLGLRALPIACYLDQFPLSRDQQRAWSLLDTLDWYSPRYDDPQTFDDVARALRDAGATRVERRPVGGVGVRASM